MVTFSDYFSAQNGPGFQLLVTDIFRLPYNPHQRAGLYSSINEIRNAHWFSGATPRNAPHSPTTTSPRSPMAPYVHLPIISEEDLAMGLADVSISGSDTPDSTSSSQMSPGSTPPLSSIRFPDMRATPVTSPVASPPPTSKPVYVPLPEQLMSQPMPDDAMLDDEGSQEKELWDQLARRTVDLRWNFCTEVKKVENLVSFWGLWKVCICGKRYNKFEMDKDDVNVGTYIFLIISHSKIFIFLII